MAEVPWSTNIVAWRYKCKIKAVVYWGKTLEPHPLVNYLSVDPRVVVEIGHRAAHSFLAW